MAPKSVARSVDASGERCPDGLPISYALPAARVIVEIDSAVASSAATRGGMLRGLLQRGRDRVRHLDRRVLKAPAPDDVGDVIDTDP